MTDIVQLLGADADHLLNHVCKTIPKSALHLPGPDYVDRVVAGSDRPPAVLRSLQQMFGHGRLADTGYLSILPVDQGVEHSAGASFAKNPAYFDPENIVKLAIEGGCNAVASTLGVLGAVSRRYAHRIPFLLKINHNEFLTYPNKFDQIVFASVRQAFDMGAVAVGATIYFGSAESGRQIVEVSRAFEAAHEMGMATVLWCYLRNPAFKKDKDYHVSADLTGIPVVIFVLGMTIPWRNLVPRSELLATAGVKLLVTPFIVWLIAPRIHAGMGEAQYAAVIEGAMPAMMTTLLLADRFKLDAGAAALLIGWTTILFWITLPLIMALGWTGPA